MTNPLRISLIVLTFLLAACNVSVPTGILVTPSPSFTPRAIDSVCVDKVATAFVSTDAVVGSFDCLSVGFETFFINYFGVGDDQTFADWISTYPAHTQQACGDAKPYDATHNYKEFLESDGVLTRYYFRQADGRVDDLQVASKISGSSVVLKGDASCNASYSWPKPKYME